MSVNYHPQRNKSSMSFLSQFCLLIFCCCIVRVDMTYAATYYIPDDFSNLQSAFAGMSGGDELVIRDGVYTGNENIIDDYHTPPSGTSVQYTVIRAEHVGGVVFDAENTISSMFDISNIVRNYIIFKGIIWCRSRDNELVFIQNCDHIKFQQCGFYDAGISSSTSRSGLYFAYCDYILAEDCYVWGEFYYGIAMRNSQHGIIRRCVARLDQHRGPRGSNFIYYTSDDIEIQNCIAIDGDTGLYQTPTSTYGLYGVHTNGPANRVHVRGSIILNLDYQSGYIDENNTSLTYDDLIMWDTGRGFYERTRTAADSIFNHCLFGDNHPTSGWGALIGANYVRNSIFVSNSTYGIESTVSDLDFNAFYDNNPNINLTSQLGQHSYSMENGNEINVYTNSLKYLIRVEDASKLSNAGLDGGRIGPKVINKIGIDGSLYGDPGYSVESSYSLWPFPNEDIIRAKMRAYNRDGINGARGFCADGQTLTKYIWEYLGNPIPPEIYGGELPSPDTTPPVISNVGTNNITATSATVTWATDEQATGLVYYGETSGYGQQKTQTSLTTSHQVALDNLQPTSTYHYKITCSDSSNNSAESADFTFTTTAAGSGVTVSTLQDFEDGILWLPGGSQDSTGNGRGWAFLDAGAEASIEIDSAYGADNTQKSLKITFDSDNPQIYFRSNDKITDHMPEAAGANRMSFYVRFPKDFPIQTEPFRYDTWQLGTFVHDPADWNDTHEATFEADHGIHHYYHRVTIEKNGDGWVKYIVTTQPDQANYSGSTVPPNITHYFDSFGRFYFHFGPEAGGPAISRPFTIWIDEIKFYHDDGTVGGQIHVGGQDDAGFDGEFIPDSATSPVHSPQDFQAEMQ